MTINPDAPHPAEGGLPTLLKLGFGLLDGGGIQPSAPTYLSTIPRTKVEAIAKEWLGTFALYAGQSPPNVSGIMDELILESSFDSCFLRGSGPPDKAIDKTNSLSSYWRDILAFTWDFRTFESTASIQKFLTDRLAQAQVTNVALAGVGEPVSQVKDAPAPELKQPCPDIAWIEFIFSFDTKVGKCQGVVRLVPKVEAGAHVKWKSHTILTTLVSLHSSPERTDPLRPMYPFVEDSGVAAPMGTAWDEYRKSQLHAYNGRGGFPQKNPAVLVIGAGQSGLTLAARLKHLGLEDVLLVEKNERVGDNWRVRYQALCLHDPVWYDHLPYIPFPETWPVYTPAGKLANWLESYADSLDLKVWTSSTVTSAVQDSNSKSWIVEVVKRRGDGGEGEKHTFTVKHLVFASGFVGDPWMPSIPGKDRFKGTVLHSSQHRSALDHVGKKVLVVGACTSAHDICLDYARHGITPTMYQRSSTYIISGAGTRDLLSGNYSASAPPTEIADLLSMSMTQWGSAGLNRRFVAHTMGGEGRDAGLIAALNAAGFKTNDGFHGTGLMGLVWDKGGGYYFDFGGSQAIIDGRVKLRGGHGSVVEFTESGVLFEDGSEEKADAVIFCTGLTGAKAGVLPRTLGEDVAEKCDDIWGFNAEGEIKGVWKEIGLEGLWNFMGNLGACRMHSRHMALQIKAREDGVFDFGERYSFS